MQVLRCPQKRPFKSADGESGEDGRGLYNYSTICLIKFTLMKKVKLFFTVLALSICALAYGQNITVKGTVTDASTGEPVPFASLVLKGTMTGTNTDANGEYSISVPSNGTLVISSVGYTTQEVAVNGKAVINVNLAADNEFLDDVIVVAFGTTTKEAFTGSAAVVNEEKLAKSQVASITNALAGAVAGVQLTSSNGAPGSTSTIRVRGFSSISAGQSPLIIVDGAPFSGDLSTINQADVESMSVLKDAASNALYGARGANGVIIITTKSAKKGQATVTFDAKYGINNRALRDYNVITDPGLYYETQAKALTNYYVNKGYTQAAAIEQTNKYIFSDQASGGLGYNVWTYPEGQNLIGTNGKINPNATLGRVVSYKGEDYLVTPDNWSDIAYRNGARQEYNVAVSAAQDRASFYASLAYLENQGITAASDMERLTGRLRADYQAKDWLKVGANFSYARFRYNSLSNNGSSTSTGNVWAFTSQMAPIYPAYVRNADGSIKVDSNGFEMMDYGSEQNAGFARPFISDANPIMDLSLNTNESEGNSISANAFADFQILPGLKFTVNGTVYVDETRYTAVYNPYYGQFDSTGGTVSKEHDRLMTYNLQQLLNYNKSFGRNNVSLMLGHEYYDSRSYGLWASKSQMFSQDNKELSGAVVDGQSAGSSLTEYNNEGYFFRGQYDYENRIFASASFRRDASSRFHPDYRWGNFWSLGAAWILSRESWFDAPWVNNLKLKASIGSQGNDNIGSYRYTDLYDISNSSGNVATYFSTKGSKSITWETNTNMNAGVEFGLFDRLTGSVEFFDRVTTDMLFSFPVAPSLGYSSYYANVGDMKNYGIEVDLGANLINTKNFSWDVNFNLTWLKNRITKLDEAKKTTTAYDKNGKAYKGYQSGSMFIAEDVSLYSWYLKDYAGVDHETGESLWYYDEVTYEKDANGNDVIGADGNKVEASRERKTTSTWSDGDYYLTGDTSIAPFYGGFGTSVQFYGFDFSINFSYQMGGRGYDSTYAALMSSPTSNNGGYNYHADIFKSWSVDNKDSDIPRFQFADSYTAASSTRFLTSSRYLNIENINFGYTFPSKITRKFGAESLRLYVAADNVWYFSARQGFDPRQGYGSSNATNYSPMRTISGGITVKF